MKFGLTLASFLLAGTAHAQSASTSIIAIPWATIAQPFDGFHVDIGGTASTAWPGGGDYAPVSAVTGSITIPSSADADLISPGVSRQIVDAGISGLAVTNSHYAPAVGGYFGAGFGVTGGQAWGINPTAKNSLSSATAGSTPFNGQVTAIEGDLTLRQPSSGWAGSNADGLWMPLDADTQLDGQLNAVHVGKVNTAPWKNGFKIDAGAATWAREVDLQTATTGASGAIPDHFVVQDGSGNVTQLLTAFDTTGFFVIRPFVLGQPGYGTGLRIQNQAGTADIVRLSGVDGSIVGASLNVTGAVAGNSGTFSGTVAGGSVSAGSGALTGGSAVINGDVAGGSLHVGGTSTLNGPVTATTISAGTVTANGGLTTGNHFLSTVGMGSMPPSIPACTSASLSNDATDVRGRLTMPAGMTSCTVMLGNVAGTIPNVVVSGSVPGITPAVTNQVGGAVGTAQFTVAVPGSGPAITVTYHAIY